MELGEPPQPPRQPSPVEPYASLVAKWQENHTEMRAMHRMLYACGCQGRCGGPPQDKRRALNSLMRLVEAYGAERVEAACTRALAWQDPTVARVRQTLQSGLDTAPLPEEDSSAGAAASRSVVYRFARPACEFFSRTKGLLREVA